MAAKANRASAPVVAVIVETTDAFILNACATFNASMKGVGDANAEAIRLKVSLLASVANTLEGVRPISEPDWTSKWKEQADKSYLASGRSSQTDPEKLKLSMGSAVGLQKVITLGLTNGIAPLKGETAKSYGDRALKVLKARGIISYKKGEKEKLLRSANTRDTDKPAPRTPSKSEPAAVVTPALAAFTLAGADQAKADKLALIAGDFWPEVEMYFDALMVRLAARKAA